MDILDQINRAMRDRMDFEHRCLLLDCEKEIRFLREKIQRIKEGYEGSCSTCEPVGVLNDKLKEERDDARIDVCILMSGSPMPTNFDHDKALAHARSQGWDCMDTRENTKSQRTDL